jgi:hypothetical protein
MVVNARPGPFQVFPPVQVFGRNSPDLPRLVAAKRVVCGKDIRQWRAPQLPLLKFHMPHPRDPVLPWPHGAGDLSSAVVGKGMQHNHQGDTRRRTAVRFTRTGGSARCVNLRHSLKNNEIESVNPLISLSLKSVPPWDAPL